MKRSCKIIGHAWDYSWHGKDYTFKICTDCGAHKLAFPDSSPTTRAKVRIWRLLLIASVTLAGIALVAGVAV